jgi:hypothetical protein
VGKLSSQEKQSKAATSPETALGYNHFNTEEPEPR